MKKIILLTALLIFSIVNCFGGVTCINALARGKATSPIAFQRQFAPMGSAPIEITIEEIENAYSFGKKQINNYSDFSPPLVVDIGVANTNNAQEWSIKNQPFQFTDTLEVVKLNATGYQTQFPNSDFALKRKNRGCTNCDEFLFANFQNEGIYLDGATNYNRAKKSISVDTLDYLLSSLPVTINNLTVLNDTIEDEDDDIYIEGSEKRVGFGTFIASDGSSHEVLKSELKYKETKNGNIVYYKVVSFVSDDGYNLILTLNDTNQLFGKVNVAEIDEFIFKSDITSVSNTTAKNDFFTVYPTPVSNTLYINGNISNQAYIMNTLGVKLKQFQNLENTHEIDVSDLSDGIYILVDGKKAIKFSKKD